MYGLIKFLNPVLIYTLNQQKVNFSTDVSVLCQEFLPAVGYIPNTELAEQYPED